MYSDPSNIRRHVVKVRLNDEEQAFAEADAAALGMPLDEYLRMLIADEGALLLAEWEAVVMPVVH